MNPAHLRICIGPDHRPSSIELIDSPDALDVPAKCESCGDPSADESGRCCYCQEKQSMKTVNLITNERISKLLFPDNQPHIRLADIQAGDAVRVVCPIRSSLELVQLLMVTNAIRHLDAIPVELVVPYLMAARYDRIMQQGDSFDLEVVADAINGCQYRTVNLFDVHSPRAVSLIRNSRSHDNRRLVETYRKDNAVLIVPDKGAAGHFEQYQQWSPGIVDVCLCQKERDAEGRITLSVLQPERCEGRNCVIIDDICDGGGTFVAIAQQINPAHLTLIVSHGIFSKGFQPLSRFDEIITSDSFAHHAPDKVTTISLNL